MQSPLTISSRVVIATHELFYGASQALRDYLNGKMVKEVLFVSHPIRPENPKSYKQVFRKGRLTRGRTLYRSSGHAWWFAFDFLLTLVWVVKERGIYDVYIGVDPLNCLAGLFLKALGLTRFVIFYSIDFVPRRFRNHVLDALYHGIESLCVRFSDERWDVSPRIAEGRKKFLGLAPRSFPVRVVPIGVWQNDIIARIHAYDPHRFAFAGHLLPKQGVSKVLEALPLVLEKVKKTTFLIIGGGEDEERLRKISKMLGVSKYVEFIGWVSDQNEIRKLLSHCAFAVALYDPRDADEGNFTYYADPTKIKTYFSCSLPVVMTAVPFNAGDLVRKGCAVVVDYDEKSIAKALIDLLTDKKKLEKMRKMAVETAKEFTWEKIFKNALGI